MSPEVLNALLRAMHTRRKREKKLKKLEKKGAVQSQPSLPTPKSQVNINKTQVAKSPMPVKPMFMPSIQSAPVNAGIPSAPTAPVNQQAAPLQKSSSANPLVRLSGMYGQIKKQKEKKLKKEAAPKLPMKPPSPGTAVTASTGAAQSQPGLVSRAKGIAKSFLPTGVTKGAKTIKTSVTAPGKYAHFLKIAETEKKEKEEKPSRNISIPGAIGVGALGGAGAAILAALSKKSKTIKKIVKP